MSTTSKIVLGCSAVYAIGAWVFDFYYKEIISRDLHKAVALDIKYQREYIKEQKLKKQKLAEQGNQIGADVQLNKNKPE